MDCKQARIQLYQGERSLALWAHLVLCGKCRAEARALRHLERAISAAPRPEPPAALLANILAIAQEEQAPAPAQDKLKPAPWKRSNRLVFWLVWAIIAALLALCLAAVYITRPKPSGKKTAPPVSLRLAPVPETVSSVYVNAPTDRYLFEVWCTPSAHYERYTDHAGVLLASIIIEPENNRWWIYNHGSNTQVVMDLSPVRDYAIALFARGFIYAQDLDYLKKVDRDNYSRATISYNIPRPGWVDTLQAPSGVKTITAQPKIAQEIRRGIKHDSLQAWVGDRLVASASTPAEDKKRR
jgi:hypothetical protein